MKINAILLLILASSAFWGTDADEGGLRASRALNLFDEEEGEDPTTFSVVVDGNPEQITVGEAEDLGEALAEVIADSGKTVSTFSWKVTESMNASRRRLCTRRQRRNNNCPTSSTYDYVASPCVRRCKNDGERKLDETSLLKSLTKKKKEFCKSDEGEGNKACNLEISSVTFA